MVGVAAWSAGALTRLGEIVRDRQVELRMTQDDLAEAAGVAVGTVTNLEAGRRIRDLNLGKINDALGWTKGSYRLVLDGGEAVIVESPNDDALHLPRPGNVSPQAWSEITEKLLADLDYYLRHQGER